MYADNYIFKCNQYLTDEQKKRVMRDGMTPDMHTEIVFSINSLLSEE